mgnify:CR=1 FL=1
MSKLNSCSEDGELCMAISQHQRPIMRGGQASPDMEILGETK